MKKSIRLTALFLIFIMLLTGCGNSAKPQETSVAPTTESTAAEPKAEPKQDTLTVALRNEGPNLDPQNNGALSSYVVEQAIYDRLVGKDENGNIIPWLATSWEEIDDTTVRFHLRDDVYFHNGEKLTANDVKYSIARAEVNPNSQSFFKYFDGEGCTVIDDYTIDVKLYNAFTPMYNYLTIGRANIVCASEMERIGSEEYGRNPIGSGPFKFESWVSGDRINLVRNEEYWGEKPEYKNLVFRFITETTNRAVELQTGGVDISFHISGEDVQTLNEDKNTEALIGPSFTLVTFAFNTMDYDCFKDVRVRQGLSEALDIEGIVATVYGETATAADSLYSPQISGHVSLGPIPYNPEEAKKLLDEGGWDYDHVIQLYTTDASDMKNICEIAKNMWAALGVQCEINIVDNATLQTMLGSGDTEMVMFSTNPSSGDPDHGMWNWASYNTSRVQSTDEILNLLNEGKTTSDPAKRNEIYGKVLKLAWDFHGLIPIAFTNTIYGIRSDVKGFVEDPGYSPSFTNVTFG